MPVRYVWCVPRRCVRARRSARPADRHRSASPTGSVWRRSPNACPPLSDAGEQGVLASESDRAHGAFDGVGVQLQAAVIRIQDQPASSGSGRSGSPGPMWNGRRCVRVFRPARPASPRPAAGCAAGARVGGARRAGHGSRPRSRRARQSAARLPRPAAIGWRRGCRRTCAAHGPSRRPVAGHRPHVCDQAAKSGIAIDLEQAAEPPQMRRRMLALAVLAIDIGSGRMSRPTPGPVVDRVAPQPSGLGASPPGIEHRQRGVVGEHLGRGQHGAQHQLMQRRQPPAGAAHPVAQCGAIQRRRPGGRRSAPGDTAASELRGGITPPRAPRTVREPLGSYGSQCPALAIQKRPMGKQVRR